MGLVNNIMSLLFDKNDVNTTMDYSTQEPQELHRSLKTVRREPFDFDLLLSEAQFVLSVVKTRLKTNCEFLISLENMRPPERFGQVLNIESPPHMQNAVCTRVKTNMNLSF
jgi:hypothetical protein